MYQRPPQKKAAETKSADVAPKPNQAASSRAPAWTNAQGNQPPLNLQPKLTVNQPGDENEDEADRVAAQVMRMATPAVTQVQRCACGGIAESDGECAACKAKRLGVQRKSDAVAKTEAPPSVHETLRSSGQPLDEGTRAFMEPRFGADFSDVRVHTDSQAAQSADDVSAHAYTVGNNLVFGAGQYAPETDAGKQLLAHELTHTVQQTDADTQVQREPKSLPEQPTEKTAHSWVSGRSFYYLIEHDIQWHINSVLPMSIDLVVDKRKPGNENIPPEQIARISAAVLGSAIGMPDGTPPTRLEQYILGQIKKYSLENSTFFFIPSSIETIRSQTDSQVFNKFFSELHSDEPAIWLMIAFTDFSGQQKGQGAKTSGEQPEADPAITEEGKKIQKRVNNLIKKARDEQKSPKDLPDRAVAWHNEKDNSWYLNIWIIFDRQGKKKIAEPIRLRDDESDEKLLERIRLATQRAALKSEDQTQRERAENAPEWAQKLERELKRRLAQLRQQEPDATDLPDGEVLVADKEILLRIWVQRGKDDKIERNSGTIPLVPDTNINELVANVRHITAILRQYENTPFTEKPPPDVKANLNDLPLMAFPSKLESPVNDLRGDQITVTGASNEFQMRLDYEWVYGVGPINDLFIASKLSSQYIHFYWRIYRLPAPQPAEGQKKVSDDWTKQWLDIYKQYNGVPPGNFNHGKIAPPDVKNLATVYESNGSDSSTRVKFPSEPGDYIVSCVTGHTPIGENKLKRQSSWSFYPVRVKPIKEEAAANVNERTNAISTLEDELKAIEMLLERTNLAPYERKALLSRQTLKKNILEHINKKESQNFFQSTSDELQNARNMQALVKRFKEAWPPILAKARAHGIPPSDLLQDQPELLQFHWQLISEGKTVDGYEGELNEQLKQLETLNKMAGEFKNEFKGKSPYQYNIEAAFVSKVTGRVYPLILILGEAPEPEFHNMGGDPTTPTIKVTYSLVDITSKQTQKAYKGASLKSGREGHKEAIDRAFEDFGEDATYGEGIIAVRIPPGPVGSNDSNHPGTGIVYYQSKEGILQKVLWALGIIAAVAGLFALAATGIGAPAAAGILGTIAGITGAVVSFHNISERSRRHNLHLDAALGLDIIGIIGGVIPVASAARAAAGFERMAVTARFLEIYGWIETGATVVLVPIGLAEDIKRIKQDKDLTDDQKALMIAEAELGAVQAGLMLLGSAVASRSGAHAQHEHANIEGVVPHLTDRDVALFRDQIDAIELEGFGKYESLKDRHLIDEGGNWTGKAREIIHPESKLGVKPADQPPAETVKPPNKPNLEPPKSPEVPKPDAPAKVAEPPKPDAPAKAAEPPKPDAPAKPAEPPKPGETAEPSKSGEGEVAKPASTEPAKAAESPKTDQQGETLQQKQARLEGELKALQDKTRELNNTIKKEKQAVRSALDEATKARKEGNSAEAQKQHEEARAANKRAEQAQEELNRTASGDDLEREIAKTKKDLEKQAIESDPKHRAKLPCFSGDTLVWTKQGTQSIATLKAGQEVLAFDFDQGCVVSRTIVRVMKNKTLHFYNIFSETDAIKATGQHPFWVESQSKWIPARELTPGMELKSVEGRRIPITKIELQENLDSASYNLSIDGVSNYFVGKGVLVHNAGYDIGLNGPYIIYVATNPDYPDKYYIGQTTAEALSGKTKGKATGTKKREGAHQNYAKRRLQEGNLSKRDEAFYKFMSEATLEPLVTGIKNKDQADYLEQRNKDLQAELTGEDSVINRREQLGEEHAKEVAERIKNDPDVQKAGLCK